MKYRVKEVASRMTEMLTATAEIGRLKKIRKLPLERMSDWRRFSSSSGPRTKARIRGAASYSNFLKRYPTMPKMTMTRTSNPLLLML